ncbi:MAG: serine hydrolase domain-containing protein, partial [Cyclobacteriaceae bacterium]
EIDHILQSLIEQFVDRKMVHGVILSVHTDQMSPFKWAGASGNLTIEQPYFLTSVAKLHLTALIMKLRLRGMLRLEDPISHYLPEVLWRDLSLVRKKDFSNKITIQHLLSHSSGLPDYFQVVLRGERTLKQELFSGTDQSWSMDELVKGIKGLKPQFKPGHKNKIHYADTNFQLLGKLIEIVCAQPLQKVIENFHLKPLALSQTYSYNDTKDRTPSPFYFNEHPLWIPKAMTSFGPVGGMVSTAHDNMVFLKAFFHGHLFEEEDIDDLKTWNPLGKGLYYGKGLAQFRKPWYWMPLGTKVILTGHSGTSGAFAFYHEEKKLFFTGTVNQAADTTLPYKLIIKALKVLG